MALSAPLSLSRDVTNKCQEQMQLFKLKVHEVKRMHALEKQILNEGIGKLQKASDVLSSLDEQEIASEIEKRKQELVDLDKELKELTREVSTLQLQVEKARNELAIAHEQRQNFENKLYPRARYAVNLYRQVSNVRWHTGQTPPEVKGFIRSKSSVKPFCFDEQKQSMYFITNSIWDMGEEDIW